MSHYEISPTNSIFSTKVNHRKCRGIAAKICQQSRTKADNITVSYIQYKSRNRNKTESIRKNFENHDYDDSIAQYSELLPVATQIRQNPSSFDKLQSVVPDSSSRRKYTTNEKFDTPRKARSEIIKKKSGPKTPPLFSQRSSLKNSIKNSTYRISPEFKTHRFKVNAQGSPELRSGPNIAKYINNLISRDMENTLAETTPLKADKESNERNFICRIPSSIRMKQENFNSKIKAFREPGSYTSIHETIQKSKDLGASVSLKSHPKNKNHVNGTTQAVKDVFMEGKLPRVAFIRRRFEARLSPEANNMSIPNRAKKNNLIPKMRLPEQNKHESKDIERFLAQYPSVTLKSLPRSVTINTFPSKSAGEDLPLKATLESTKPEKITSTQKTAPVTELAPRSIISVVRDKIKLFERGQNSEAHLASPRRESITRKLNRNLRGLFESWNSTEKFVEVPEESRALSSPREPKDNMKFRQRGIHEAPFQEIQAKKLGRESLTNNFTGSPLDNRVWLIKEAECGLKQPKPLRVTEIRRMTLLCRGTMSVRSMRDILH